MSCGAETFACLRPDGSGWLIVRNSEVQDGAADHCYMQHRGCSWRSNFDPGWLPPSTLPWSLGTNLDWLKDHTG